MKPFDQWVMEDPTTPLHQKPMLPEGLWEDKRGVIMAQCRVCERWYAYGGDPEDGFDPNMSYCGGSPRCCP
jgi:hypothetical protein